MAFRKATAHLGAQNEELLSADNFTPERHILVETLRKAAPLLGLKASVITTLDAMMSCLPPKRNHHTVFASNQTLAFRRNGISDRTIRRHAAILSDLGLLIRRDSPNRKRFTRHNKAEGKAIRFGFDLTPLFSRFQEIAAIATKATEEQEAISYLKAKLRCIANEHLSENPYDESALEILRALRRKLSKEQCDELLQGLKTQEIPSEGPGDSIDEQEKMSASNGQFVRHHHNSKKELNDNTSSSNRQSKSSQETEEDLSVADIVQTCSEAAEFASGSITSIDDVVRHGQTLAPMIGIDKTTYDLAQQKVGPVSAALTVWAILQFHDRIHNLGAYFRALTVGKKSHGFCVVRLIQSMMTKDCLTPKLA